MLRWRALSPNHFTSGEGANQVLCAILGWPATPALIPNSFRASVRTTAAHIGIPPIRVGHLDRRVEPAGNTGANAPEPATGAARLRSDTRQGRIPRVGKGRKLSGFCGKCGARRVICGKYEICKLRNSVFLRLSRPAPPEWGSEHFTGRAFPQAHAAIEIA